MIPSSAEAGRRAANENDVTAAVDLLHAVARGTAHPLGRGRRHHRQDREPVADRVTAIVRAAR